ncbi:MAG TPA: hypothetical protein VD948_02945 [Rhodothermales bacterium]|nr:hypothetical protein [Rhodothermales bacterium]
MKRRLEAVEVDPSLLEQNWTRLRNAPRPPRPARWSELGLEALLVLAVVLGIYLGMWLGGVQ